MQVAEQEKYGLHLKLENFEIEYDNTIKELQYDIGQLRQELVSKTNQTVAGDKEKLLKIRELTQQVETFINEPRQDKTNKTSVRQAKTQISLGIRVFAVRMKKPWVLSYPLSAQRRL